MSFLRLFLAALSIAVYSADISYGKTGFFIRGGLLNDSPRKEVFQDMESGIGYMAGLGYDFFPRIGLDIGVLNSTHEYRVGVSGNAVRNDNAEKTSFFIRAHYSPLKSGEYEILLGGGPSYYSINGTLRYYYDEENYYIYDKSYNGWGLTAGVDLMYYATENLAITFFALANFIEYSQQSVNPINPDDRIEVPRGDSMGLGIALFYRIGKPQ
jgi:hypothetical protein